MHAAGRNEFQFSDRYRLSRIANSLITNEELISSAYVTPISAQRNESTVNYYLLLFIRGSMREHTAKQGVRAHEEGAEV